MKINEIVGAGASPLEKWLDTYHIEAMSEDDHPYREAQYIVGTGGPAREKFSDWITFLGIASKSGPRVFDPPIGPNDWNNIAAFEFNGAGTGQIKHIINDFTKIPNLAALTFSACNIKSLKGIDKLNHVRKIWLHDVKLEGGLLRLLKMPNLEMFNLTRLSTDEKTERALDILEKHINSEERDVPECQQELIEAGLQEFAKL